MTAFICAWTVLQPPPIEDVDGVIKVAVLDAVCVAQLMEDRVGVCGRFGAVIESERTGIGVDEWVLKEEVDGKQNQ